MAVNRYDDTRAWYAISTYSGYEDKVADSINQRVNTVEMADKIFEAIVPKEKQIEIKNGKRKVVDRKILQGYVLVEMKLSDETWYIIRNTPGVTGFIGTGTQPTPVSEKEITKIKKRMGVENPKFSVNYAIDEVVSITDGPFKGFDGTILVMTAIDTDGKIVAVSTLDVTSETATLGGLTAKESYTSMYSGKDAALEGVDAISGATVTSKAIARCVNSAVAYVTGADVSSGATSWGG